MKRALSLTLPLSIFAAGITGFLLWFTYTRLSNELTIVLKAAIYFAGFMFVFFCLAALAFGVGMLWQKYNEAWINNRRQSFVITIAEASQQVYLSDLSLNLTTPLHLQAGQVNGHRSEPWTIDIDNYRLNQLAHATAKPAAALPAPETSQQIETGGTLPDVVNLKEYVFQPSLSSVFLGVGRMPGEVQPRPIIAPLERLVHIATAGSSGFGKSTFMQALAYQALNSPDSRPVLLDAQGVTFSAFEGHPALLARVASDEIDISHTLDYLLDEMERRKALFGQCPGVAKLRDYNSRVDEPLYAIPVFFDELGLLADNRDVAHKVRLLVQGGRKFGLFLILGSQTWLASQFSTALRSNLSTSVQFAARDKAQSRVLLSAPDAAKITLPGRAYAILPGQAGLVELQAPIIEENELRPAGEVITLPDPATARARAMREAGLSHSAIARELFKLNREPNGREIKRVKSLLGESD